MSSYSISIPISQYHSRKAELVQIGIPFVPDGNRARAYVEEEVVVKSYVQWLRSERFAVMTNLPGA